MKNKFYIFFSWQSDVPGNRSYIDKKIKAAITEIKKMPEMKGIEIDYDHSTQNRAGSPDIVETIHEKINNCDVFIADITPITAINTGENNGEKLIPNPNVMTEAGFALRAIGNNRIILLMRSDKGNIDDLPFDIRHRRVTLFPNDVKEKSRFSLTSMTLAAIEYSRSYKADEHQDKEVRHDTGIFLGLRNAIGDEGRFLNTVSRVASDTRISKAEYDLFETITTYIGKPEHEFIIPKLQSLAANLRDGINAMTTVTAKYYAPSRKWWVSVTPDMTPEEVSEAKYHSYYVWVDTAAGEYLDSELYNRTLRIIMNSLGKAYNQIIEAYTQLRKEVKQNLFI